MAALVVDATPYAMAGSYTTLLDATQGFVDPVRRPREIGATDERRAGASPLACASSDTLTT